MLLKITAKLLKSESSETRAKEGFWRAVESYGESSEKPSETSAPGGADDLEKAIVDKFALRLTQELKSLCSPNYKGRFASANGATLLDQLRASQFKKINVEEIGVSVVDVSYGSMSVLALIHGIATLSKALKLDAIGVERLVDTVASTVLQDVFREQFGGGIANVLQVVSDAHSCRDDDVDTRDKAEAVANPGPSEAWSRLARWALAGAGLLLLLGALHWLLSANSGEISALRKDQLATVQTVLSNAVAHDFNVDHLEEAMIKGREEILKTDSAERLKLEAMLVEMVGDARKQASHGGDEAKAPNSATTTVNVYNQDKVYNKNKAAGPVCEKKRHPRPKPILRPARKLPPRPHCKRHLSDEELVRSHGEVLILSPTTASDGGADGSAPLMEAPRSRCAGWRWRHHCHAE